MNTPFYLLLSFLAAYLIVRICIPFIISAAKEHNLLDKPDGRKQHKQAVPALGGIAIFVALIFTGFFWMDSTSFSEARTMLPALLMLFFTGISDDLAPMRAGKKLLLQLISVGIVMYGGFRITDLHGMFGFHSLPLFSQSAITILFMTAVINAYNLIDGVDGLAGGISLLVSVAFAALFYATGDTFFCALSIILSGALIGFLQFNFNPAKIFMGDTGSLLLGFMMALFGIRLLSTPTVLLETISVSNPMTLVMGLLFLPVFDTMRVFYIRLSAGHSPFHADRKHLHHILQKNNLSSKQICVVMYGTTTAFVVLSWILQPLNASLALILLFSSAIALAESLTIALLVRTRRKMSSAADALREQKKYNQFLRHIVNI